MNVTEQEVKQARNALMSHALRRLPREDAEDLVQYSIVDAIGRYQYRKAKFINFAFKVYRFDLLRALDSRKPKIPKLRRVAPDGVAIARAYASGKSVKKIADEVRCSPNTIWRRLVEMDIPRRDTAGRPIT